jgi:hypothetical protein
MPGGASDRNISWGNADRCIPFPLAEREST